MSQETDTRCSVIHSELLHNAITGKRLNDYQHRALVSAETPGTVTVLDPRDRAVGTTYAMAWAMFWRAVGKQAQNVIFIGKLYEADYIHDLIGEFTHRLETHDESQYIVKHNRDGLHFTNGSRILLKASSPHALRGHSVSMLALGMHESMNHDRMVDWMPCLFSTNGKLIMEGQGFMFNKKTDVITSTIEDRLLRKEVYEYEALHRPR